MRLTRLAVLLAVLCVGGWTVGVQAEQGQMDKDKDFGKVGQPGSATGGSSGSLSDSYKQGVGGSSGHALAPALMSAPNEQQIHGKILGYKDVDVQGDKDHRVLRVQTRQGQTVMVDLGREDKLPDGLKINEGQWVIVTGMPGRLGNDDVLVAHNLANVFNFMPGAASHGGAKIDDKDQSLYKHVPADKDLQKHETDRNVRDDLNAPRDTTGTGDHRD